MKQTDSLLQTSAKVLLAIVLLGALVAVAGADLAPNVPLTRVLWVSLLALVVVGGLGLGALVLGLGFSQWRLRVGGTDAQWLAFGAEPPGLQALRSQMPNRAAATDNPNAFR